MRKIIGMITNEDYSFRTTAGTCIVTPERIVLERHGFRRALSNLIYGDSMTRAKVMYAAIVAAAFGLGIWGLVREYYLAAIPPFLVGLGFMRGLIMSRNTSIATVIERSSIKSIETRKPYPPFVRGYFTVWFLEKGKKQRRFIMMPSVISDGNAEYPRALQIMQEAGLLNKNG